MSENKTLYVVGSKSKAKMDSLLNDIPYEHRIKSNTIEFSIINTIASLWLRNNTDKRLSHYRKVYQFVGNNLDNAINDPENNLMKELKGDGILELLCQFDHTLIDIIDEEIANEQQMRKHHWVPVKTAMDRLNKTIEKIGDSFTSCATSEDFWHKRAVGMDIRRLDRAVIKATSCSEESATANIRRRVLKRLGE